MPGWVLCQTLEPVLESIGTVVTKVFDAVSWIEDIVAKRQSLGQTSLFPTRERAAQKILNIKKEKSRMCKTRTEIEPVIPQLQRDRPLLRNFLKGVIRNKINGILDGAVINFRITQKEIKEKISFWLFFFLRIFQSKNDSIFLFCKLKTKMILKMIF